MNWKRICLLLLSFLNLCPILMAQEEEHNCNNDEIAVFFVNGVMNSRREGSENRRKLEDLLYDYYTSRGREDEFDKMDIRLAYNTSFEFSLHPGSATGALTVATIDTQFSEIMMQFNDSFLTEGDIEFWRTMNGIYSSRLNRNTFIQTYSGMQQAALDRVTSGVKDISQHIRLYTQAYLEGKKIVLVSHSQGNFFANLAYQGIEPIIQEHIGIVGLGTPDDETPSAYGNYLTYHEDAVINKGAVVGSVLAKFLFASNTAWPGFPLPPNKHHCEPMVIEYKTNPQRVERYLDGPDPTGHNFILSYARCDAEHIARSVEATANKLELSPVLTYKTILTATMIWGASTPDYDLHVWEPGGYHLFYAAKNGPSGVIDVDDTNGLGPEHFYGYCNKLQEGIYYFGANLYAGNEYGTNSGVSITLEAGDKVRNFYIGDLEDRGSFGNANHRIFAGIKVEGNHEDGFTFDIFPVDSTPVGLGLTSVDSIAGSNDGPTALRRIELEEKEKPALAQ